MFGYRSRRRLARRGRCVLSECGIVAEQAGDGAAQGEVVIIRSTFVHHSAPCLLNDSLYHETCDPVPPCRVAGCLDASWSRGGRTMEAWVVCGTVVGLAAQILLLAGLIVAVVERKRGT